MRSPPSTSPRISSAICSPGSGRRWCRSTTGNISRPATTRPRRSRTPSRRRPPRCRTRRTSGYKPGVLVAEQYVLSNPALNFAQFLLRAVLPTVLHVVAAIAAGYAVGSEFSQRSKRAWMRAAGGRPLVALIGKLLPLFAIFIVMMVVDAAIIHVLYGVTFRGDPLLVAAAACLLLIGYLSFGALLVLLTQALPTGLSLIAHILQSGVRLRRRGIPGRGDGGFPEGWGSILPLRWYLQILFDQAARGLPASDSVRPFMVLAGLACLYFALAWLRLRAIANAPPKREETPVIRLRYGRGVAIAMGNEARRILADRSGLGPDRACAARLWSALSAALSRPGSSRHPDRRRRSGSNGAQPRPRAGPERG